MSDEWKPYAIDYDPIKVGSIDATDTQPHDKAIVRALKSKYKLNPNLSSDPKCTLFVARFHLNTNEDTIQEFFSKYGSIVSMRLVRDIVTGFSKRYAFIEYKDMKTAKKVYEEANNAIIDGKKILVDYECSRTMSGWKPRRLGGGFGGKKESGQLRFGCRDRPWKRPITTNVNLDSNLYERYSSKSLQFYGKRYKDHEEYNVRRVETNSTEKEYRYRYDNKRKKK